jgi:hypothetical protein
MVSDPFILSILKGGAKEKEREETVGLEKLLETSNP